MSIKINRKWLDLQWFLRELALAFHATGVLQWTAITANKTRAAGRGDEVICVVPELTGRA
jgi:hypothetical protein